MKRFFACILVIVCCMNCMETIPVSAADEIQAEDVNQDKIDALFEELNSIALEEYMSNSRGFRVGSQNDGTDTAGKKALIDAQLEELGVHKIDPENPDDMAYLAELPASNESNVMKSGIYDSAPDLSALAKAYSVYISDGTINPFYNGAADPGESYSYRWIRVVDDKGLNRLYNEQKPINLLTEDDFEKNAIEKLLAYTFRFILSQFLGKTPEGIVLDWSLGMFEIIASGTVTSNKNTYEMWLSSLSEMTYYYLYYQGWKLIGVSTRAQFSRSDMFRGTLNGIMYNGSVYEEKTMLYAQDRTIREYVTNYVSHTNTSLEYCMFESLGTLGIKGYNNREYSHTPIFARLPIDLM